MAAGAPGGAAAYVFVERSAGWASTSTFTAKLTAPDALGTEALGSSVAMSSNGSTVVVGAPLGVVGAQAQPGAVYVFGNSSPPTLSPTALSNDATYGTYYSRAITATEPGYTGSFNFSSMGLPNWLTLSSGQSGELLSGTPNAVGTFTFTITATDSNKVTGSQTYTLKVDPAPLTITATNSSKLYGQPIVFLGLNGFNVTGLVNGDTVYGVTLTSAGTAATATVASPGPNYPITPSAAVFGMGSAANYNITYVNGILTVDPAPLTITASNQSKTYGTAVTPAGTEFTAGAGQLVNGDTVTSVTLSSNGYAATATVTTPGPNYPITPSAPVFSVGSAGNYSITYVSGTLTVNPRPLTITAFNTSKTYGQFLVFFERPVRLGPPTFSVGATTTTPPAWSTAIRLAAYSKPVTAAPRRRR
jgi:hypothetical protein